LQAYFNGLTSLRDEAVNQKLYDFLGVPAPPLIDIAAVTSACGSSTVAGRYTCTRKLDEDISVGSKVVGIGMHGGVLLATRRATKARCVVKSLDKRNLSRKALKYVKNEVEMYLALDHPHIAQLEQVYETSAQVHLVMEYLEGGELFDRIASRKGFSEVEAARLARQVLLAIAYLHASGIMHGDVKPENFLFEDRESQHMKLIDFGMSRKWDGESKMTDSCGTLLYASPVVLLKSFTTQADIWSAGVLVYALLCGCHPWKGSTNEQVTEQIKQGKTFFYASRWNPLSADAKDFIQSLLTLDPDQRPTASSALKHSWLQLAAPERLLQASLAGQVSSSLGRFAATEPATRACWTLVATCLPKARTNELRNAFLAFDHDDDGRIGLNDFKQALRSISSEDAAPDALFGHLDADSDGRISYREFLAAASYDDSEISEIALRSAFDRFDVRGVGALSSDDFAEVLGEQLYGREVRSLLLDVLGPHNAAKGTVTLEHFRDAVTKSSSVVEIDTQSSAGLSECKMNQATISTSSSSSSIASDIGSESPSTDSLPDLCKEPVKEAGRGGTRTPQTRSFAGLIASFAANCTTTESFASMPIMH